MKGKAAEMIHYHDEYQLQVCKSLVHIREFDSEEEAKAFTPEQGRAADVTHVGDKYLAGYSKVGEAMSQAIIDAAVYYNMRIPFDGDYQIGHNWENCH